MSQENERSTQVKSHSPDDEQWEVAVNRDKYILDGHQIKVLKEATMDGNVKLVWFDTFAIAIPYINSIRRTRSGYTYKALPAPKAKELSPAEQEKMRGKMAEIRNKLFPKTLAKGDKV